MANVDYKTIDEYIQSSPLQVREIMQQMRMIIKEAEPRVTEKISWGMATFCLNGNLVHFAAQKKHLGFHPTPSAIEEFSLELQGYKCSKGTVQLPYDKPLPVDLIAKMVKFRAKEQDDIYNKKMQNKKL